tara:strand:+ start:116 stop:424 length:309 start_codon:yes stop_codon:yes gene_type:complete
MSNTNLSPDQIISGTESAYIIDVMPKNLYDRLYSEKIEKILLNREKYPTSVNQLLETLKKTKFYSQLTIKQVRDLYTWTETDMIGLTSSEMMFGDNFFSNER